MEFFIYSLNINSSVHMTTTKFTSSILLLLLNFHGFAQNRLIQFQNISYENGISDNRISNVLQDQDGFLWFSTKLGIDKYDGKKSKSYALLNEHTEVNTLIQDRANTVWAATIHGLFYYNVEKDNFERYLTSDPKLNNSLRRNILSVLEVANGELWCANANGEIISLSLNSKTGTIIYRIPSEKKGQQPNYGTDLLQDNHGVIWISTSQGGIIKYQNLEFHHKVLQDNTTFIRAISIDLNDQLWIGTRGNGLFRYNTNTNSILHYTASNKSNSISNNIILDVLVDKNNNVWIGTDGGGLNLYIQEENSFSIFKQNRYSNYPIADNSILSIHEGMNNVIWIGTVHGGASYFKNYTGMRQIPPSDLAFNQIDKQGSRILEDSKGDIWITAGRNGLRRYNPKTSEVSVFIDDPKKSNDLSGNNVLSLFEDDHQRIWIGTLNGGLNVYDTKSERFLSAEDKEQNKSIFAIEKDTDGNIWVGTDTGIRVYNSDLEIIKSITSDNTPNLNTSYITSLYNDLKGDMWVGTNLGLNVFKKDTIVSYQSDKSDPNSLSGNRIISIAEADDLSILVGTYGYGLNKYDRIRDQFIRIGKEEGLEAQIIGGIFLDDDKNIWCSTNLGLSKIKPDGRIVNFGVQNGVQTFSGGSASISREGHILMGGRLGLTYFKANELEDNNTYIPKVFFTSAAILGDDGMREVSLGARTDNRITLSPEDNLLTIYYSSSDYWDPKGNTYSYKIEGLNNDWQSDINQQVLTFSNLKPGEYSLMIKPAKHINYDDSSVASIAITVLPSFWQKTWVRSVSILIGLLLILSFVKLRLSTIKKQRERLQLLVTSKTEEVKTQQDKIYQSEIALLQSEKEKHELSKKKLLEELVFKTEELTNYTLRTVHKNHLLTEIKSNLLKETKNKPSKNKNLENIIELIDDSLMLDEEWENFYNLFNQIHPTFIKDLKEHCPQLTDREIRVCALIKLNFNSQHMATLFGISLNSVKISRHRLRRKLNIPKNDTFEDFFKKVF